MKKLLAIILASVLILMPLSVFAAAKSSEKIPCIIVPGIGQSRVWLTDENGDFVLDENGEKINCFPAVLNVDSLLSQLAGPLAASVAAQRDVGFSDALCSAVEDAFSMNATDDNGEPCGRVTVETYPHSLAQCTQDEKDYIFGCIPMERLCETIGEENIYYYAYNSFGNALDMIDGLYDFIGLVKEQTGSEKVNIIPISMGGAIFNGVMEFYPQIANDLNRTVFVIPALNGSTIVSDIYKGELTFLNADYLYSEFFDGILNETEASAIELAIRVLPKDVLMSALEKAVDTLMETAIRNCTGLWMLVPNEEYDECVRKNLSDKSKAEIRRQTDAYHKAQSNSNKNILKLKNSGVEIFNVVAYDVALYNVGNSWNKQNADGVIHTYSTAMGTKMANVGEELPKNYVQKNTYCKNPSHNHISPDRVVDATTGLLPDTTFFFDGQSHVTANQNDIIMKLCCELVETDRIKDVYSDKNFPQFNIGRETKKIRTELLPAAENVDRSALSAEDAAELDAAVNEANEMLARTVAKEGEAKAVEERLSAVLAKIGAIEPKKADSALSPAVKKLSDLLFDIGGANGYTDIGQNIVKDVIGGNGDEEESKPETPTEGENGNKPSNPSEKTENKPTNSVPKTDKSGVKIPAVFLCVALSGAVTVFAVAVQRKRRNVKTANNKTCHGFVNYNLK